jgi:hypothetical protein
MKLISVQSRGDRLVRVVCDDNGNNFETIEKQWKWHEKQGLVYESGAAYCGTEYFALKRAESFLKGATA